MNLKEREELVRKVERAKEQISVLRKQQVELEREKTELEDLRGKQEDWSRGKKDVSEALKKTIVVLEREESETTRMSELVKNTGQTLSRLLDELRNVKEDRWTPATLKEDITKALLIVDNGRKELSKARARIPALDEKEAPERPVASKQNVAPLKGLVDLSPQELLRVGFWIALPLALMALLIRLIFYAM